MIPFHRRKDGRVSARFRADEAQLLRSLAEEAVELARASAADDGSADPALRRLLPDAYPDDPEASAEFRRFTAAGLAERKEAGARTLIDSLGEPAAGSVVVVLDAEQATAWLRTITDLRLVLAARLGIHEDGDEGDVHDDESAMQRAVYDWLAAVQEFLVLAVRPRR
ncbi:DUF2017 domain-containing protein [Leifsonia shinshuensis]|uniref:DUF2017 domain-containing protein n=1 Tax=Leifsonia shinshuensis TaxID=150026 RepID=UPI00286C1153|nr:DUF2017 domain-containing protein [Leifsonia shinshuensis]